MRIFLLSGMGFEPFRFRLKKFSDRSCKLLIWLELEARTWRPSAQNLASQGFARKILRRWDLATANWAGERVEKYCWRLFLRLSILLIVYRGVQGWMSQWGCGKG